MKHLILVVLGLILSSCGGQAAPPPSHQMQSGEAKLVVEEIMSDSFKCYALKWSNTGHIISAKCYPKE